MAQINLKIRKVSAKNPKTQELGYAARLITNGTADFADIAKYACKGSTISSPEMECCSSPKAYME